MQFNKYIRTYIHANIHTYIHTYITYDSDDKAGLRGYVQFNKYTYIHTCRKERVGSVAANPDNLGSNKEAGGGTQGAQGSNKICTSRESVSPLSRLIRGFRNK